MDVLRILFIKEFKNAVREKLLLAIGFLVFILLETALFFGYTSYVQDQKVISDTQGQKRKEWLGQGEKHPHIAAHFGTFVFKPKTVLTFFDFGLDSYTGTSVYLEAHYQHEFMFRPAQDYTGMIRFGEFSIAMVLQVLFPLVIIFMSFSSFTKEREIGTYKLMISQGVSVGTIFLAKILMYFIFVLIVLLPVFIVAAILAHVIPHSFTMNDVLIRLGLLVVVYATYLFVFIFFSVVVSLYSKSSKNALLLLLACWVLLTIVIPKTTANLSKTIYSLPSIRTFKEEIQQELKKEDAELRMEKLLAEYLKKYQVDSIHHLPINFEGVMMQNGEEHANHVYDTHWDRLRQLFYRQNQTHALVSLVNPFMAVQHLSMALCATDFHTFTHFEDHAEHYRRALVKQMNDDMANNSHFGEFYSYKANADLWSSVKEFEYSYPFIFQILNFYRIEILSLFLWGVLLPVLLWFFVLKKK